MVAAPGEAGHHALEGPRRAARPAVEADAAHGVGLGDVEPAVPQVHAVGPVEAGDDVAPPVGPAVSVVVRLEEHDASAARLAHEQVAPRREAQEAGVREVRGEQPDPPPLRRLEPGDDRVLGRGGEPQAEEPLPQGRVHGEAVGQEKQPHPRCRRGDQGRPHDDLRRSPHRGSPSVPPPLSRP
jgi:hypothetical protein